MDFWEGKDGGRFYWEIGQWKCRNCSFVLMGNCSYGVEEDFIREFGKNGIFEVCLEVISRFIREIGEIELLIC